MVGRPAKNCYPQAADICLKSLEQFAAELTPAYHKNLGYEIGTATIKVTSGKKLFAYVLIAVCPVDFKDESQHN